jgi:hypothetical protein
MRGINGRTYGSRLGLTVLECLFAMGIMLIGLTGIALMIPFAGRQAADSYSITHALASGENALAVFESNSVSAPSLTAPWQLVEDEVDGTMATAMALSSTPGDSNGSFFVSMKKLIEGEQVVASGPRTYSLYLREFNRISPANAPVLPPAIALAQNRALGASFCIDPLFWSRQHIVPVNGSKLAWNAWGNFRRTRFPYYQEYYDPTNPFGAYSTSNQNTPRMYRISLRDPDAALTSLNRAWLRGPGATRLASGGIGDVMTFTPEADKTRGPIRGFYPAQPSTSAGTALTQNAPPEAFQSWIATLTPDESTPWIEDTTIPAGLYNSPELPAIPFLPTSYQLSVVVFAKRNVNELVIPDYTVFQSEGIVPDGERVCSVTSLDPISRSSGIFDITINASPLVNSRVRVGDWLMMSRHVYLNPYAAASALTPVRQVHKWYRVLSVSTDTFPMELKVSGQPWDWTSREVDFFNANSPGLYTTSASLPALAPASTVVTLVPNVVNVYQRTFTVEN